MAIQQLKDEYEILDEIGSGGMATVYKAVQKSLDRPVAIKQLKRSYHADSQIVKRFERESRVAASLQHENIVHIYDYWKRPHFAIVMEYVDGTDLAEVLEKTGPLPVDVGIMIAIQVCSALDYAHMRGLVHRDIKPGNIMIKRNGEVKLMDFGIAHTRHLDALTMPGTLIGTPAYMSPEQILGQPLDFRSDIFSFGIVLYEMFTGVKPFTDDDASAVTAKIVKDGFTAPRRVNSGIPCALQRIIKKCLRKKPQRRYASMLDVEKKLGKRLAGRTTKPASLQRIADYLVSRNVLDAAPEQETMIITGKPGLSRRWKAAAWAALLALLATSAGYYYVRTRQLQQEPLLPRRVPSATQPLVTGIAPTAPSATTSQTSGTSGPATAPSPTPLPGPSGRLQEPAPDKGTAPAPVRQPATNAAPPASPSSPPGGELQEKEQAPARKTTPPKKKKKKAASATVR
jgi:serine/threonine protein kinase